MDFGVIWNGSNIGCWVGGDNAISETTVRDAVDVLGNIIVDEEVVGIIFDEM